MQPKIALIAAATATLIAGNASAAEAFQVRYNIAGSLGGEVFAPPDASGPAIGLAYTFMDIKKVTGDDGKAITMNVPGGTVPLPSPTPSALYPTYAAETARINATGAFKLANLAAGYVTEEKFGGGCIAFGVVLPYGVKTQNFTVNATTPALLFNPAIPSATQSAVSAQFGQGYQGALSAEADAESGKVTGFGDLELQGGWLYVQDSLRLLAGASIVLPTGKYDASPGPDIGFGNFYTFRPAVQVGYLVTPDIALAGKVSLGLNTRNKDNDLRSGDWASFEGAVGYKSPIGAIGLHTVYVQQFQSDSNNSFGASRFRTMNAGAYFTTLVPGTNAALTLQYMATTSSRNAKAGDFSQIRIVKVF